jgi:hypothetical protein
MSFLCRVGLHAWDYKVQNVETKNGVFELATRWCKREGCEKKQWVLMYDLNFDPWRDFTPDMTMRGCLLND